MALTTPLSPPLAITVQTYPQFTLAVPSPPRYLHPTSPNLSQRRAAPRHAMPRSQPLSSFLNGMFYGHSVQPTVGDVTGNQHECLRSAFPLPFPLLPLSRPSLLSPPHAALCHSSIPGVSELTWESNGLRRAALCLRQKKVRGDERVPAAQAERYATHSTVISTLKHPVQSSSLEEFGRVLALDYTTSIR